MSDINIMSFITVIYGDNQQRMFNPECTTLILLECIRKHCYMESNNATLDLTDAVGNIKHLPENLNSYANVYLEGRATYWLVKVEKGRTEEDPTRYTLLINNSETHYPDLLSKLEAMSRPPSRNTPTSARRESGWVNVRKKLPRSVRGTKRTSPSIKKK